jgi:hypothetical protein
MWLAGGVWLCGRWQISFQRSLASLQRSVAVPAAPGAPAFGFAGHDQDTGPVDGDVKHVRGWLRRRQGHELAGADLLAADAGYPGLRAGCCADRVVQRLMSL